MEFKAIPTTCPYCGCGCGFFLEVMDGKLVGTTPSKTSPINQGKLCIKGWTAHEFVENPERLTQPLLRKNGKLVPVSWDEAFDFAVSRLKEIKEKHGPDSICLMSCARTISENNYLHQKFARAVIGTHNVDHCARV